MACEGKVREPAQPAQPAAPLSADPEEKELHRKAGPKVSRGCVLLGVSGVATGGSPWLLSCSRT